MRRFLAAWFATALPFLALDAAWLSTMAQRLYQPALGAMMRADFGVAAAAAFYLLYVAGIVVFAVWPSRGARGALLRGGFLGLVAYATYDLTNQATLSGWPWRVTLADLAWGTFATAAAAATGYLVTSRSSRR
ncbi:MAG: DUF2177 family protein [Ramlibacter sp.]